MKKIFILFGIIVFGIMVTLHQQISFKENEFSDILIENDIVVEENNMLLTKKQISGLLLEIYRLDTNIIEKYEDKINQSGEEIELNSQDILELHYYSLNEKERKLFLEKASSQVVSVSMDDSGSILISYNPNFY